MVTSHGDRGLSKLDQIKALGAAKAASRNSSDGHDPREIIPDGTDPRQPKREFRRPLAKDRDKTLSVTKPWEAEGMSRASWYRRNGYRRQKEEK
jgi:hypothetical protein